MDSGEYGEAAETMSEQNDGSTLDTGSSSIIDHIDLIHTGNNYDMDLNLSPLTKSPASISLSFLERTPTPPISDYDSDKDPEYIPSDSEYENGKNLGCRNEPSTNCIDSENESEYCESEQDSHLGLTSRTPSMKEVAIRSKPSHAKKPAIRRRDFCYYCESEILNFARHMKRHHVTELEVQEILSKKISTKERKTLFTKLRKKGNYLKNSKECFKPMKQAVLYANYLPCSKCLGFYSAKQLYRHRRKCRDDYEKYSSAQAEGQNLLTKDIKIDKQLRDTVFPHMIADKISLEAKQDPIICAFGARYLKLHREKHFVAVTSRKMRELAKLLIEVRKVVPSTRDMCEVLQPKYYDVLVQATKTIASYDAEKDVYGAPTYAMNISTSLKQCCDIAISFAYKKQNYGTVQSAEIVANLKTMNHLLNKNWRFDISSQAGSDLSLKKWNKITIVPLASDLKLLKKYLQSEASKALSRLSVNKEDLGAFIILLESAFCRVILLNRKRPGELERIFLHTYESSGAGKTNYEEFNEALTPTEKILINRFKRVVTRGKRGRGVPVLFDTETQDYINKLIEVRPNFVNKENLYLFAKPHSIQTICGYKTLEKYAKACGARNPEAITSTRLRKHLATLTQVFNLNENEIEQLANFMGHTTGVHKGSYRLPDDVYQTAKISKLLLLMEEGRAGEFKGKTLDDINIDLHENLVEDSVNIDNGRNLDIHEEDNDLGLRLFEISEDNRNRVKTTQKPQNVTEKIDLPSDHKKRILIPWTCEEKRIVEKFFKDHIKSKKPPRKYECEALIEQHPGILGEKSWLKIKVYVQNKYSKKK